MIFSVSSTPSSSRKASLVQVSPAPLFLLSPLYIHDLMHDTPLLADVVESLTITPFHYPLCTVIYQQPSIHPCEAHLVWWRETVCVFQRQQQQGVPGPFSTTATVGVQGCAMFFFGLQCVLSVELEPILSGNLVRFVLQDYLSRTFGKCRT